MAFLMATWMSLTLIAGAIAVLAQLPAEITDLRTVTGENGMTLRYKEPGLCERIEGANSYSGLIDVSEDKHLFFWFFESGNNHYVA